MQFGTNPPNEPESYFSHLSCNYLSVIQLHRKYRGHNSGSFRRNACFRALSSGNKQHTFFTCQRTTPTIPIPQHPVQKNYRVPICALKPTLIAPSIPSSRACLLSQPGSTLDC